MMEQRTALVVRSNRPAISWNGIDRVSRSASAQPSMVWATDEKLKHLAGEISWYEEESRKSLGLVLQYRLEIGKRLACAKALLAHGKFLSWARGEFGWSSRHVQNHLTLAANSRIISRLEPGASIRMALAVIRTSQTEPRSSESTPPMTPPVRRVHLVGEIEEGELDMKGLLAEMGRVAAAFGASKTSWKAR